jgi:hypothetical protein
LAINAHKMDPRPHQRLQDRTCDAPTKGLLWVSLWHLCSRAASQRIANLVRKAFQFKKVLAMELTTQHHLT